MAKPTNKLSKRTSPLASYPAAATALQPTRREPVISPQTKVRPVRPNEMDQAIRVLVFDGSKDPYHLRRRASAFKKLAVQEQYDLNRLTVAQK